MNRFKLIGGTCAALAAFSTTPSHAVTVTFSQLLLNSCVLTVNTNGSLVTKSNGQEMNSEAGNGVPAALAVVAVGAVPKVTFTAPALSAPNGDSGSVAALKYTSLSGANQAYTTSSSNYTGGLLIDTYTVDAKVTNSGGFAAGTYQVTTTATCSQS